MTTPPYRPQARTMRALGMVVTVYEKVSGFSGYLRPAPQPVDRRLRMRVTGSQYPALGVRLLRLEPLDERPLPPWQPGAHVDVELPGIGLRQYSLCGDPARRGHLDIAVRRLDDGDGGSLAVHGLRVGDGLTVRGPRNAFPFVDSPRYLFLAGGIGITPIRPMVHAAVARGSDWQLVYTGRSRSAMPFLDEFLALAPDRVHVHADDETGAPDTSLLTSLLGSSVTPGAALYACGPPGLVATAVRGLPPGAVASVHHERFSPAPVVGGEPFELVLARSGHVVPVAADETALAAVRRVLPDVMYSCRQGFCGTCPVGLLGGQVEHRDRCLTDAQRALRFAPCVSRGTGRVTVDL